MVSGDKIPKLVIGLLERLKEELGKFSLPTTKKL